MSRIKTTSYRIRRGIPLPARHARKSPLKDTLLTLNVGDSFGSDVKSTSSIYSMISTYRTARMLPLNYRVTIAPDPEKEYIWRIWRVE